MNNEINNELNEIEVNDAETSDIFEEEVNLTRSESREQAFMLLCFCSQSLLTMSLLKKQ